MVGIIACGAAIPVRRLPLSLLSGRSAKPGSPERALACVDADGRALMPCGRCRQLLHEHGGPDLLVDTGAGPRRLAELLPDAFGPEDLDRVRR